MKLTDYHLIGWEQRKIKRRKKIGDLQILLLSLTGLSPEEGRKNIVATNAHNEIIWIADLPTSPFDSYYEMKYKDGVVYGRSSNSFMAEIDPLTGGILKKYMVY